MQTKQTNQNLSSFLTNKTLFYKEIDYTIIVEAWNVLQKHIHLPYIIHIIGTNGKGSTGRFLASFLFQSNFKTLHYSSPHILEFNERIWINGNNSTNKQLDLAHLSLQEILSDTLLDKLTYFEYTTLLALYLSNNLDFLVLEAGLGGEFDATNIVENNLTLITTIGLDHTEFLGNTIKDIATTKMKSCNNTFILGKQVSSEIEGIKRELLKNKKEILLNCTLEIKNQEIQLPKYLENNLQLALTALEYLDIKINDFVIPKIFGRYQRFTKNIIIDVGHNSLAAKVLVEEYKNQKIILIYNSYKDKDYKTILQILKPICQEIQIINIDDNRMVKTSKLITICTNLSFAVKEYDKIDENKKYLVFGSFKVVEEFIKRWDFSER